MNPLGTPDKAQLIHDEPSQEMAENSFLQHVFEHLSSAMLEVRSIHGLHIFFCCSVVYDSLWPRGLYIACQAPLSVEFSRQEYWSG